jgi:antimicrobial peptide system SdpB family protein
MKKLINRLYTTLTTFIATGSSKSIIGFSRSILAAGVLLKLVFNNINLLITPRQLQTLHLSSLSYRCNFFLIFNSSHLVEMQILAIIILAFVITGYYMKITSLLHLWISLSLFMFRQTYISVDRIDLLLILLLIPVCLFDERKNHWHHPVTTNKFNSLIQNIFLFLIKIQVAFIYYDSFHDKLFIREWLDGTVIYYWFTHNFFGLHPSLISMLKPVLTSIPVLFFLSWGTLQLEALLAVAILIPSRFKLVLLKCGIIFHFGIMLIHGYSFLFFVMSAALFLYLYPAKKTFTLYLLNEQPSPAIS